MNTEIHLYTGKKGSNPGGKCLVKTPGLEFDAYIKYCPASKLGRRTIFRASHQPIYEALSNTLIGNLGLDIPEFYVLLNKHGEVIFTRENEAREENFNDKMPYYYVSKLVPLSPAVESTGKQEAMAREKLYRDVVMVSDVSNKAQNFRYNPDRNNITYIDLGCSFVEATNGSLHTSSVKLPDDVKANSKRAERLKNELVISTKEGILPIEQIINVKGTLDIPTLNPKGKVHLNEILSLDEIEEISKMLKLNLLNVVKRHKNDPRLFVKS